MPAESVSSNVAPFLATLLPIVLSLVFYGIVGIAMAILSYFLAKNKGLNKVAALFAGFVGGLITVLIIVMIPKIDGQNNEIIIKDNGGN